jgi:hypothetical protein
LQWDGAQLQLQSNDPERLHKVNRKVTITLCEGKKQFRLQNYMLAMQQRDEQ